MAECSSHQDLVSVLSSLILVSKILQSPPFPLHHQTRQIPKKKKRKKKADSACLNRAGRQTNTVRWTVRFSYSYLHNWEMFGTCIIIWKENYSSLKRLQGKRPAVCCCPPKTAERLRCLARTMHKENMAILKLKRCTQHTTNCRQNTSIIDYEELKSSFV